MLKKHLKGNGCWIALLLLIIIPAFAYRGTFLNANNIFNVLRQSSMIGVISVGMTCVILTAGIDLSVGSTTALAAVLAAMLSYRNQYLAILLPVCVGAIVGLVNGITVAKLKIVPFIATLAVQMAVRGIVYIITNTKSVSVSSDVTFFSQIGRGYLFVVPIPVILFALVAAVMIFVSKNTSFGRSLYAIGGNEDAARMMGIKVDRNRIAAYTLTGAFAGLAGLILCARMNAGQPTGGDGWEMDAVAAVAIGGTLLTGGVGTVEKTIAGVLIYGLIGNIINLQGNINSYVQKIIMGAIVLAVIIIQKRTQGKENYG
ncbi:MAG: ABC transporter permease [Lachnospiraceae bacterium]|nr:ABC transporter permease [Lachnospiraceae bacterium]